MCFADLNATRPLGTVVGAISFAEIEAYRRLTLADLSAWDVGLIHRLDNAVRAILTGTPPTSEVPVTDTAGVRSLMRGLAAAKKPDPAKPATPSP